MYFDSAAVLPAAWQLLETLRVACFSVGVRLERVRVRAASRRERHFEF